MKNSKPQNLAAKLEKVQREVSEVKEDIRFLKSVLLQVNVVESKEKDKDELKKLEDMINKI
jgi:hypothetical protein